MNTDLRENAVLLSLTGLGLAAGIGIGIARGQSNWPVYLAVTLVGAAVVIPLHTRLQFTRPTRIGLAIFALGHVAGGMIGVGDGVLYQWWILEPVLRYDNIQHAVGFGFVGRAIWEGLRRRLGVAVLDAGLAVWIIVLGAGAAGAFNEIIEWILTLTITGTDVGGYDNTVRDLVANLVGGLGIGTWTARSLR